jgi:hypothetical protein
MSVLVMVDAPRRRRNGVVVINSTHRLRSIGLGLLGAALQVSWCGCGLDRLQPALPAAIPGFTLAKLKDIQDDERLTDDEKREQIRQATGAPNSDSGDRLVDFLLNMNVP